jgi:hypothetical protein
MVNAGCSSPANSIVITSNQPVYPAISEQGTETGFTHLKPEQ